MIRTRTCEKLIFLENFANILNEWPFVEHWEKYFEKTYKLNYVCMYLFIFFLFYIFIGAVVYLTLTATLFSLF